MTRAQKRLLDRLKEVKGEVVGHRSLALAAQMKPSTDVAKTVKVQVSNVRKELSPGTHIENVRGEGYRYVESTP